MNNFKMQHVWNTRRRLLFWRMVLLAMSMVGIMIAVLPALAQEENQWSPQRTIPGFHPETDSPILVADQNRTVHAFSSQWIGGKDNSMRAVMYNQWTFDSGWSTPVDILLSPWKNDARILGASLDQSGLMHIIFFGGDETEANIYYAQAPAVRAGEAPAWSKPIVVGEGANSPDVAALSADDQGNLVIAYSGRKEGNGLYTLYSSDRGQSWTEPEPTFLTYDAKFPFILKLIAGQSGAVHAVWDVRDKGGNGRQINYARLSLSERRWSEPVTLAEAETGYGVLIPTVVEHDGEVFVAYSGISIRRSDDGGETWSEAENPFRLTGINGIMSFVVDSNDTLHLLWAQRLTGSPDIHGVWHSEWRDGQWSEAEAVVSGPAVHDFTGNKTFDPYDVRSIVSQGNVMLITWRQDPGLTGNGVWYSHLELEAPELEPVGLAVPATVGEDVAMPTAVPTAPTVVSQSVERAEVAVELPIPVAHAGSPVGPVAVGVAPVAIILVAGIIWKVLAVTRRT